MCQTYFKTQITFIKCKNIWPHRITLLLLFLHDLRGLIFYLRLWFLRVEECQAAEICRQVCAIYGVACVFKKIVVECICVYFEQAGNK
jgi:hypothetical protein